MCKAKHYSEDLLNIYNNVITEFNKLVNELSQADLYEQDVLHMIENGNFSASEGYRLSKMLYENRKRRREIKNELEPLSMLKHSFIDKNMSALNNAHQAVIRKDNILSNLTENKVYTPRVIGKTNTNENISNFTPIPIPSSPVQSKVDPILNATSNKPIHKKTNEELQIVNKLDSKHYLVKRRNGKQEIMNKCNILNLEHLQLA